LNELTGRRTFRTGLEAETPAFITRTLRQLLYVALLQIRRSRRLFFELFVGIIDKEFLCRVGPKPAEFYMDRLRKTCTPKIFDELWTFARDSAHPIEKRRNTQLDCFLLLAVSLCSGFRLCLAVVIGRCDPTRLRKQHCGVQ
jgi:hypothetical protein